MAAPSLQRLSYISRLRPGLDQADIDAIVASAQRHNATLDLTGALGCTGEFFVQFLEGEPAALDAMLARISADDRHGQLQLIARLAAPRRAFGDWSMVSLDLTELAVEVRDLQAAGALNDGWLLLRMKEELRLQRGLP